MNPSAPDNAHGISDSQWAEIARYERLFYNLATPSFKKIDEIIRSGRMLTEDSEHNEQEGRHVSEILESNIRQDYKVKIINEYGYPRKLKELETPLYLFYYVGNFEYLNSEKIVAVVGSRKASKRGIETARFVSRRLVEDGYTVISGLAEGIDTAAHTSAIESGGKTIAVIGTPLSSVYPKENVDLQKRIETEHLVISQVPFALYSTLHWKIKRSFFPERNKVMAALSFATIIVETSETSGTRIQARECLRLGRKLIFLSPAADNPNTRWPVNLIGKGASLARTYTEIADALRG